MAVVDTFTRLIFDEADELGAREQVIIEAFRSVDDNVLMDTLPEMGEYLRNLGVREMIHLVARIREHIQAQAGLAAGEPGGDAGHGKGRAGRRPH
ncbi:MAG: hypothetical protein CME59_17670 [Halioglobus sp.]|nr:hypothetical protein [Halioglobus sp.]